MRRTFSIIVACTAVLTLAAGAPPATAVTMEQLLANGGYVLDPGSYRIGGRTPRCGATKTLIAPAFWDYGGSLPDLIIVNPQMMSNLPWRVQLFVYHHECAHQSVGSDEVAADCHAITTGREEGWLSARDVETVCAKLFIDSSGDRYHPAGPQRCAYLRQCYQGGRPEYQRTTPTRMLDTLNRR